MGYHENGKVRSEVSYVNGRKEGIAKYYDNNGHIRDELPYVNGHTEGIIKSYYTNGYIKSEVEMQYSLQKIRREYLDNGELNQIIEIKYNKDNKFKCQIFYNSKHKYIKSVEYDKNGKEIIIDR